MFQINADAKEYIRRKGKAVIISYKFEPAIGG